MKRHIQYFLYVCCGLLLLPVGSCFAADSLEVCQLKAAFIYNFTLFVTWPQSHHNLRMCVLGESSFLQQLQAYEGRKVNGAILSVEPTLTAYEARGCQVLVIGSSEQEQLGHIKKILEGAPVLTVAESGNFSTDSVHILLTKQNDRIAFDINQTAATASGLGLSFKLLKLARKVY